MRSAMASAVGSARTCRPTDTTAAAAEMPIKASGTRSEVKMRVSMPEPSLDRDGHRAAAHELQALAAVVVAAPAPADHHHVVGAVLGEVAAGEAQVVLDAAVAAVGAGDGAGETAHVAQE